MVAIQSISTTLGDIQIVQAQAVDIAIVQNIYEEIAAWLLARGIRQWLPEDFSRQRTMETIEHGQLYLAQRGATAIGMLSLHWSDRLIWGNVPPDAGYVHGLAVRRSWASHDIGGALLQWAGAMVVAEGRAYLRLDCWADNSALCRYYEQAGFTFKGFKFFSGRGREWRSSLYEKKLT